MVRTERNKISPFSTAFGRSCLICYANYPGLSAIIIGSLVVGLAYLSWVLGWPIICAAIFGSLIGAFLTCSDLGFFCSRAIALLNAQEEGFNSVKVGLRPLDAIIGATAQQLEGAQAQIASLKAESSTLEENYELLTNNLAAAILIRNATGKITYCSPFTEVLTGYPIQEIYAASEDFFLSVVHADDREKYERALKVCAAGEAFQVRYRLYHKTGIEMWVETRTVPVLDDRGSVTFSLSITLDVTAAVRYQRQVEEKNRDLRDFTYMVSHDLKAPIFTIKGMLTVLREDFSKSLSPEMTEIIDHIETAAKRLETLVTSVLEFSRISAEDIKFAPILLNHTLDEVRQDFATSLNKPDVSLSVEANLPNVLGDKVRIYQIFSNLIGNSLKYRDPSRPLRINVEQTVQANQRMTTICVKDNGLGIPPDKLEDVFRPFHRAHTTGVEGTGIGLATVRRVLEKLGGEIHVENQPGGGSAFYVTLRRA
jgi:PAS domain S-box-containing protein